MTRPGCLKLFVCLALFIAPTVVCADDTEQRDYSVFVDGKESGNSKMTIVQKDDGSSYMSATLEVKFRHLLVMDYAIKLDTQEWWKDGKLIGLKTVNTENGKKTEVTAAIDNKQLRLRVNGNDKVLNPDTWTTSFWKLADARFHNKRIPILESDSGKEFNGELKYVGPEKIAVAGKMTDCYHFLVTNAPGAVDLWFDKYHRLVRQEFTESGHKTIVQLVNVKR